MKRLIVIFTAVLAIAVFLLKDSYRVIIENELSLENIEALASTEKEGIECMGVGNVECRYGVKSKVVVRPFSLR
jgi:hypothetical protein